MRTTLFQRLIVGVTTLAIAAVAAHAYTTGYKKVAPPTDPARVGIGYGPGWVGLTFDKAGRAGGPIIGYLFYAGLAGATETGHMDVYHTSDEPAASVNTPFAEGYAYGHFDGCAWSYLDPDGLNLVREGDHHSPPCRTPTSYQTKDIFCTDSSDPLCNDGLSADEFEAGVWKSTRTATIASGGCDAYGNVGANAIYHGGHVVWANPLGHIPSGTVGVRYVTRLRGAAMVKVAGLPYGMKWAFVPRSCLTP